MAEAETTNAEDTANESAETEATDTEATTEASSDESTDDLTQLEASYNQTREELRKSQESHKSASDKISEQGRELAQTKAELDALKAQQAVTQPQSTETDENGTEQIDLDELPPSVLNSLNFMAGKLQENEQKMTEYMESQAAKVASDQKFMQFSEKFGMDRQEFDEYQEAVANGNEVGAAEMLIGKNAVQQERDKRAKLREASETQVPPPGSGNPAPIMPNGDAPATWTELAAQETKRINELDEREKDAAIMDLFSETGHGDEFAREVMRGINAPS